MLVSNTWKIFLLIMASFLIGSCSHKPKQKTYQEIAEETLNLEEKKELALYLRGFYEGCKATIARFTYQEYDKDPGLTKYCLMFTDAVGEALLKAKPKDP